MRKFLTLAATGAAVATLGLAGTANAAVSPKPLPRAHTTLSIVEQRNVIKAGQRDLVSGRLAAGRFGLSREFVVLDRIVGRDLVPVQVRFTNRAGVVTFVVEPRVTARYELVFLGTRRLAHTHSGVVTVKVIH